MDGRRRSRRRSASDLDCRGCVRPLLVCTKRGACRSFARIVFPPTLLLPAAAASEAAAVTPVATGRSEPAGQDEAPVAAAEPAAPRTRAPRQPVEGREGRSLLHLLAFYLHFQLDNSNLPLSYHLKYYLAFLKLALIQNVVTKFHFLQLFLPCMKDTYFCYLLKQLHQILLIAHLL